MKIVPVASVAIRNEKGEWLLRQRPAKGLLANLWEFPMIELTSGERTAIQMQKQLNVEPDDLDEILSFKHIFSHFTWEMQSFKTEMTDMLQIPEGCAIFYGRGSRGIAETCTCY